MRLHRRIKSSPIQEVAEVVDGEFTGSGCSLGYGAMHQRLKIEHGLVTSRETVRQVYKIVDPEGFKEE